jgi:hypothetical protein
MNQKKLDYLPCFYLLHDNKKIPFLCSLFFIDKKGVEVLPPITKKSIDEMHNVTNKNGLLITRILNSNEIVDKVNKTLEKIKKLEYEANIMFLFADQDTAEQFYIQIKDLFKLELIKRT